MSDRVKVVVFHSGYGCDTGCCSHIVQFEDGREDDHTGLVSHPEDGESEVEFAKRMVTEAYGEEHVADLDWGGCDIVRHENCWN